MPFKTFTDGSVLTANEVNDFIMNQQIMVFNNGAARDEALVDPIHGMIVYLKSEKRLAFYDDEKWRLI